MERIPFAVPDITEREVSAVVETMRSGWLTTGPSTQRFEEQFAELIQVPHALAVNSCTSGLHLALDACGVRENDAVVLPTLTFTASAEVVRYLGAYPYFADIDPETGLAEADSLRAAAERAARDGRTVRVIMPVHYAGQAVAMQPVMELARELGARVVEDAAHAFPTTCDGQMIGRHGDVVAFSFYATKTLTTGEGGMVTTRDDAMAKRMRVMRLHGISRDVWDRYNTDKPSWYYEVIDAGYKYNLSDMASAVGLVQLNRTEAMWEARASIARRYDAAFAGTALRPLRTTRPEDRHAHHLYVVRIDPQSGCTRDSFIQAMAEQGVGTSVHFIPLHRMPFWRDRYELRTEDFPGAEELFAECVSLPIFSSMTEAQVERVIAAASQAISTPTPTTTS
jgi:dTDP-4-amino-4,6-dideoxygalactose transaminase